MTLNINGSAWTPGLTSVTIETSALLNRIGLSSQATDATSVHARIALHTEASNMQARIGLFADTTAATSLQGRLNLIHKETSQIAVDGASIAAETTQIKLDTEDLQARVGLLADTTLATSLQGRLNLIHKETSQIAVDSASIAGETSAIHAETTQIHVETSAINAMVGASNAATNATSISGRINLLQKEVTAIAVDAASIAAETTLIHGETTLIHGETTLIHGETTSIKLNTENLQARVGLFADATNATSVQGRLGLIHQETSGIFANSASIAAETTLIHGETTKIYDEVLLRFAQSGSKTIATAEDKSLTLDSGAAHAEILGMTINGVVGVPWTVRYYIPAIDGVVAENTSELRVAETYTSLSTAGGLIDSFVMPFNAIINFANPAAGNTTSKISQVSIMYRSATTLTVSWEA